MSPNRTIGIVGAGLIGGSIGLRARREGFTVLGCDVDDAALTVAQRRGCIDEPCNRDELYARSAIVVLAMPVDAVIDELERIASIEELGGTVVIDVASVKAAVVAAARGLRGFVGTHPMAGSEGSGAESADAALFDGRTWAYVPSANAGDDARVVEFIRLMGADPMAIDADVHDAAVARTSHMPQIFAWLFTGRMCELSEEGRALCGPVARELVRIGSSRPHFWRSVLQANADNVAAELRAMASALENYRFPTS